MYKISENITFKEYVELILESRKTNLQMNISFNHHIIDQFHEIFNDLNKYCLENNINFIEWEENMIMNSFNIKNSNILNYFNRLINKINV